MIFRRVGADNANTRFGRSRNITPKWCGGEEESVNGLVHVPENYDKLTRGK